MTNELANNVKIKIISSIKPTEGEEERYEMWLHGTLVERAGTPYIKYEEVQDDQKVETTIKCTSEKALILRNGAVKMRLPLNRVAVQNGHYENMYGQIPLQTNTTNLLFEQEENKGRFLANYDLIINGASVGHYKLEIQYQEV